MEAIYSFLNLDVDESIACCLVIEFVEFNNFCGQSLDFHAHEFGVRHGCHSIKILQVNGAVAGSFC